MAASELAPKIDRISGTRTRMQLDWQVAIYTRGLVGREREWELYRVGAGGLEMFERYATEKEADELNLLRTGVL